MSEGWRFFLVGRDGDDLRRLLGRNAANSAAGALPTDGDVGPLFSPITLFPWPAGWVRAVCKFCTPCPGEGCTCGATVLRRRAKLVWWHVVLQQRCWLNN